MRLIDRPIMWPLTASILCLIWSLVFWFIFFDQISYGILRIPMGLGGALYYIFFAIPVIIGSFVYEIIVHQIFRYRGASLKKHTFHIIYFGIPFLLISILLIVFCPMDVESTYIEYFYHNILKG